jgi:hypothetical protein
VAWSSAASAWSTKVHEDRILGVERGAQVVERHAAVGRRHDK